VRCDRGPAHVDVAAVAAAFSLGRERTMQEDVAFGFRQLVDIAEKALSPGINDPTTAVQALDEIHGLLRRLVVRPLPDGVHEDADGHVRLLLPAPSFGDFLALALDEIEQYGADPSRSSRSCGSCSPTCARPPGRSTGRCSTPGWSG
jgi:uncharacterized membrane protein